MLKKQSVHAFIQQLNRASNWLDIGQGRTIAYLRLLEEFDRVPFRSRQHILAYHESCEIVELLELWEDRIDQFPGLKARLRAACMKGPIVTEDEKPSTSSNKPRNDVFAYLMAGKFLAARIPVSTVDGISASSDITNSTADISFRWNTRDINVECKRINSPVQLLKRAKDARNQIVTTGRSGVIAIDCSVIARPPDTLLETRSPLQAEREMSEWLEYKIVPQLLTALDPEILGFILLARFPAMTGIGIFNPSGQAYHRRDQISSILAVGNRSCSDQTILQTITQRLRKQALAPERSKR